MASFPLGGNFVRRFSTATNRRVVVTGIGLVTCLGVGVETVWGRLLQGECGLSKLQGKGYEQVPCQVAGHVPYGDGPHEFNRQRYIPKSQDRGVSLAAAYAVAAAEEALTMAGWKPQSDSDLERTGVCIGSGMVSLEVITNAGQELRSGMYRKVSPWFVPEILINIPAGIVSLMYGLKDGLSAHWQSIRTTPHQSGPSQEGIPQLMPQSSCMIPMCQRGPEVRGPNHAVSTACTTGLHAIGDASRFIHNGDADVMVAGGAEACIGPLSLAGFARMRALSTSFNHSPHEASRPFDAQRDGFVMSEGAGLMVLEELSHAQQRGATILGEVLGYGLSGDAHHITTPSQSGDGALRCMKAALKDASIGAEAVGHVNAHATSTPIGDAVESRAIQEMIGKQTVVTSNKGALGHLLGAAGSVEAVLALKSCQAGLIPPTLNLTQPDTGCDLDYVTGSPRSWATSDDGHRIALTNSFGFGGTNASVCLANFVS